MLQCTCKCILGAGAIPIFVFSDMVVPKKTTDVPMMTTRFTCSNTHALVQISIVLPVTAGLQLARHVWISPNKRM